jgi:hypothetical protein
MDVLRREGPEDFLEYSTLGYTLALRHFAAPEGVTSRLTGLFDVTVLTLGLKPEVTPYGPHRLRPRQHP